MYTVLRRYKRCTLSYLRYSPVWNRNVEPPALPFVLIEELRVQYERLILAKTFEYSILKK